MVRTICIWSPDGGGARVASTPRLLGDALTIRPAPPPNIWDTWNGTKGPRRRELVLAACLLSSLATSLLQASDDSCRWLANRDSSRRSDMVHQPKDISQVDIFARQEVEPKGSRFACCFSLNLEPRAKQIVSIVWCTLCRIMLSNLVQIHAVYR